VDNEAPREWQEIAAELTNEFDPNRIIKLSKELNEALSAELRVLETQQKANPRVPHQPTGSPFTL
jgi:hypothetical protein